jgi:extracellular elastinolytic metalloproteinase
MALVMNQYHDILYKVGFNELAGNFQAFNFGKGGKGGDAMVAQDEDSESTDNAEFATPPE